ncbi:hypothetical protein ALC57_04086, partial [Trachymyrmex cornetzi]
GRLALFENEWREITSNPKVLHAVSGYKIPFISTPPARPFLREPSLSPIESENCDNEIKRLYAMGAIVTSDPSEDQFLSSFFLIKKSSRGIRFILNLRDLNTYLFPPHFKMEDWRTVVRLMLPNYVMATIDLEDAYFSVPIHPSHSKFLRF